MNEEIRSRILREFAEPEQTHTLAQVESITLRHVMAESQSNLDNTCLAVLKLSSGNLAKLETLVKAAKEDFRDVIYWADLENGKVT
jgi:hypothetical protein